MKSFIEQEMNWCAHFNGVHHATCKAGVAYADVRDESVRPFRYPCFRDNNAPHLCAQCRYRTREEAEEKEREAHAAITEWANNLAAEICPHCKTAIVHYRKVGRCVYAEPCGHRLYQGDPPKGKPQSVVRLNDGWDDV